MRKLRIFTGLFCALLTFSAVNGSAAFNDVDKSQSYNEAIERISSLGIIKGLGDGNFQPNNAMTREQFAKIMVVAAGLEDSAGTLSGSSAFPDVDKNSWSAGYISMAVEKGYILGYSDGNFYPQKSITYAMACTVLVRALGYTDQEIAGVWPKNYIEKARVLGLTQGMSFTASDELPRWATAVMVDKLMATNIKSAANVAEKTFADATGVFTEAIILGIPKTMEKLAANQVQTDKGIYYVANTAIAFDVGVKYKLVIKKDTILNASNLMRNLSKISVKSVVDNKVAYYQNSSEDTMVLPDKTLYYYQGIKQSYDNVKTILQSGSSIIFTQNVDKTGFEYAVIFDPIMRKPFVVNTQTKEAEILNFVADKPIISNGTIYAVSQVLANDLIYQIKDAWGNTYYNLLVRSTIKGKITAILPNKFSPKTVQVDNKNYDISKDLDITKLNASPGSLKTGDSVVLMLDNTGKIAEIGYLDSENNSNFALVLNTSFYVSDQVDDFGKIKYNVKLMFTDGTTNTYHVDSEITKLKGKLVTFTKLDEKRVVLTELEYLEAAEHTINVNDRLLDDSYVADNAVLFNILSNDSNAEVKAEILHWTDITSSHVTPNKILFTNKTGSFNDINVILSNDLADKGPKLAVVKSMASSKGSKQYTLLIEGREYQYLGPDVPTVAIGSVFKVKMANNAVSSIMEYKTADELSTKIQAMDTKRIKMGDKIYFFKSNATIYRKDGTGNITTVSTSDIDLATIFGGVSVYLDKSTYYGGKVETIVINE